MYSFSQEQEEQRTKSIRWESYLRTLEPFIGNFQEKVKYFCERQKRAFLNTALQKMARENDFYSLDKLFALGYREGYCLQNNVFFENQPFNSFTHYAFASNNLELLGYLVKQQHIDWGRPLDHLSNNALQIAVKYYQAPAFRLLVEQGSVDIFFTTKKNTNVLHAILKLDHENMALPLLTILFEQPKFINNYVKQDIFQHSQPIGGPQTPFQLCLTYCSLEVAHKLVGVVKEPEILRAFERDLTSFTPQFQAKFLGLEDIIRAKLDKINLEHHIEMRDSSIQTPSFKI